jgi:hypothetical protein
MEPQTDSGVLVEEKGTRRNFFVRVIYAMWAIIGAALSLPAATYLLSLPKSRKNEEWIDIGDVAGLAIGEPVDVSFRRTHWIAALWLSVLNAPTWVAPTTGTTGRTSSSALAITRCSPLMVRCSVDLHRVLSIVTS